MRYLDNSLKVAYKSGHMESTQPPPTILQNIMIKRQAKLGYEKSLAAPSMFQEKRLKEQRIYPSWMVHNSKQRTNQEPVYSESVLPETIQTKLQIAKLQQMNSIFPYSDLNGNLIMQNEYFQTMDQEVQEKDTEKLEVLSKILSSVGGKRFRKVKVEETTGEEMK